MRLKYHQATYDLLTKTYIDTTKAIENYDRYDRAYHRDEGDAERQKRRSEMLAWTRLDLYQRPVQSAKKNIEMLHALEQQYNVQFPAAVREWYSLDIMPEIMSACSWGVFGIDKLKPMKELDRPWSDDYVDEEWYFLHDEYIDEGGEDICFSMNAGDDPPVLAESGNKLIELAPTFSKFMYLQFWDWYGHYTFEQKISILHHPHSTSLQLPVKYHVPFERLRQRYIELEGNLRTRFYDEHTRIWVYKDWEEDDSLLPYQGVMRNAVLRADTIEALAEMIHHLWGDDAPVFKVCGWMNEETTELITQLQRTQLRKTLQQSKDWITVADLAFQLGATRPYLSEPTAQQLAWLIEQGEAEAHPDNRDDDKVDNRYRARN